MNDQKSPSQISHQFPLGYFHVAGVDTVPCLYIELHMVSADMDLLQWCVFAGFGLISPAAAQAEQQQTTDELADQPGGGQVKAVWMSVRWSSH